MSGRVILTGHIDVPLDQLDKVSAALPIHIELTRAEAGCLKFDVEPCPDVPGRFLLSEMFESEDAFKAHQARAKASDWAKVTTDVKRDFSISVDD